MFANSMAQVFHFNFYNRKMGWFWAQQFFDRKQLFSKICVYAYSYIAKLIISIKWQLLVGSKLSYFYFYVNFSTVSKMKLQLKVSEKCFAKKLKIYYCWFRSHQRHSKDAFWNAWLRPKNTPDTQLYRPNEHHP